jgi:hypothetical protein
MNSVCSVSAGSAGAGTAAARRGDVCVHSGDGGLRAGDAGRAEASSICTLQESEMKKGWVGQKGQLLEVRCEGCRLPAASSWAQDSVKPSWCNSCTLTRYGALHFWEYNTWFQQMLSVAGMQHEVRNVHTACKPLQLVLADMRCALHVRQHQLLITMQSEVETANHKFNLQATHTCAAVSCCF